MVWIISLSRWRRTAGFPQTRPISTFCFFKSRNAEFRSRTLENTMQFAVYLEVIKRNTDDVASGTRQHHPPVCQELACRSISHILPQNRLLSSSCLTHDLVRNGVRHCLLPQRIPNLLLCW